MQQRGSLAWRPAAPIRAHRLRALVQALLVALVLVPGDVARMRSGNQRDPFVAGHAPQPRAAVDALARVAAPVDEGAGVSGVVQCTQHLAVVQRVPHQLALVRPLGTAMRECQLLLASRLDRGAGRTGAGEGGEQPLQAMLHVPDGVEHERAVAVVDQPHGRAHLQLAAARLVQDPALQTCTQHVQFGLAHRALEPEQQSVVEVRRVVHAVLVADQRGRQRADLQQPMPVHRVARQARDLQAEHDAGVPHADLGHQALEALAVRRGAGLAEVAVDHDDALLGPAERHRALAQAVLALGALGVLEHLPQCRLTHVQVGVALEVAGLNLLMGIVHHARAS